MTPDKEENKESEYIELPNKYLVEKLINTIIDFGYGETEFHTRDISQLIGAYSQLEKENKKFAEWCSLNNWEYDYHRWNKYNDLSRLIDTKTTTELLEIFRSGKEGEE